MERVMGEEVGWEARLWILTEGKEGERVAQAALGK